MRLDAHIMILVFQNQRLMGKTKEDWVQVQVLWNGVHLAYVKHDTAKKKLENLIRDDCRTHYCPHVHIS